MSENIFEQRIEFAIQSTLGMKYNENNFVLPKFLKGFLDTLKEPQNVSQDKTEIYN